MADSLGTNPIIVDLSTATDRTIGTGRFRVKKIVISGSIAIGPPQIAITEGSVGQKAFQFWHNNIGAGVYNKSHSINAEITNPYFLNISNRAWASGATMAIYLE